MVSAGSIDTLETPDDPERRPDRETLKRECLHSCEYRPRHNRRTTGSTPRPTRTAPIQVITRMRCADRHTFDSPDGTVHNQFVILRRAASASLLLALLVMPCLSLCSGWSSSAGMRMACCVGSEDHSSQTAADSCCALGQQRQNSESAGRLFAAAVPAEDVTLHTMSFLSAVPVLRGSRIDVGERDHVTSTSDTHLLLSVFLI